MATQNFDHPLPAPPSQGQQHYSHQQPPPPQASSSQSHQQYRQDEFQIQQDQQRPSTNSRPKSRSRAFSFRSDKSQKTEKSATGSGQYRVTSAELHETSKEKESNRLHSKADPTLAMNEAEPSAVAQQAATSAPLRSIQHKDPNGVPISEPDRSNPTRSKWERPLDTIRSFEAAIDGGYSRKSVYRADTESLADWNRRSSYYGSEFGDIARFPRLYSHNQAKDNGPRFPQGSYYGGRPESSVRPQSGMYDYRASMMSGPREGNSDGNDGAYHTGGHVGNGNGGRNRYSRMQSEPVTSSGRSGLDKNVYPLPANHRSYETVATTSGGSYAEPAGYQTDPSSENSSINRQTPPKRQEPQNDYGITFGQTPGYQPPTLANIRSQPRTMPTGPAGPTEPPAPPTKDSGTGTLLRKSSGTTAGGAQQRPDAGEKRKSWFTRRFSKSS